MCAFAPLNVKKQCEGGSSPDIRSAEIKIDSQETRADFCLTNGWHLQHVLHVNERTDLPPPREHLFDIAQAGREANAEADDMLNFDCPEPMPFVRNARHWGLLKASEHGLPGDWLALV
jgi:hypothetical protein